MRLSPVDLFTALLILILLFALSLIFSITNYQNKDRNFGIFALLGRYVELYINN